MAPDVATLAGAYTAMSGQEVALDGLTAPRLATPAGWVGDVDEPTKKAWRDVSVHIPEIDFLDRDRLFEVGLTILLYEAAAYHRKWAEEVPDKYGADVLRLIRRGFAISDADYRRALDEREGLAAAGEEAMAGIDVLVLPATAIVAPPEEHGPEVREQLSRFTRPFNTTHQPVVVLPAPTRGGLPVGIQVAGRTNAETLRAAAWLEKEWQSPD
jgi:Asp-tRNA(Asn)/Glu-tRNA(Gln) amidotransferase A subunit family amidase